MNIKKAFLSAIDDFRLVEAKDRICIGFSGGKDSLLLTYLFSELLKWKRLDLSVHALHVMQGKEDKSRFEYYEKLLCSWNITLSILSPPVAPTVNGPSSCYSCSIQRREQLMHFAHAQGYTKIALGHHLDDILTTFLMNSCLHGKAEAMAVRRFYPSFGVTLIRPLAYISEESISRFVQKERWPTVTCQCASKNIDSRLDFRKRLECLTRGSLEQKRKLLAALTTMGAVSDMESHFGK
ncbi:MAG TPA: tRNA 2-thiocytidine biosynthesis TtcA family protein [Termitinemataceae bacterium]|nr:tRNA 2-thiocytidine biosynthesis TtcA family protein [Termitinemataceae bacterium]HOM23951.1 tRNA 2-thiocytidine biosynthesis TtcA family protein [Termitinemataceae bacterium]HPQ01026.1 tRNA 2-thiocytidine biosynthesis TtcA family protein [Termitinemataceae bacterium]